MFAFPLLEVHSAWLAFVSMADFLELTCNDVCLAANQTIGVDGTSSEHEAGRIYVGEGDEPVESVEEALLHACAGEVSSQTRSSWARKNALV